FDVAEGHALRLHSHTAGGRGLACSEAVNLIVHDDVEQVNIAAHGVNEMIAADAEAVSVATSHHHSKVVIGQLYTGRNRQGAAVQGVHPVRVDEPREVR